MWKRQTLALTRNQQPVNDKWKAARVKGPHASVWSSALTLSFPDKSHIILPFLSLECDWIIQLLPARNPNRIQRRRPMVAHVETRGQESLSEDKQFFSCMSIQFYLRQKHCSTIRSLGNVILFLWYSVITLIKEDHHKQVAWRVSY